MKSTEYLSVVAKCAEMSVERGLEEFRCDTDTMTGQATLPVTEVSDYHIYTAAIRRRKGENSEMAGCIKAHFVQ
jgi:hypothetical protein